MTSNNFNPPRSLRLRAWMVERNITFTNWAEQVDSTKQYLSYIVKRETMPTHLHEKCIKLGFPAELLPTPCDMPVGRKPKQKTPFFPGLVEQEQTQAQS